MRFSDLIAISRGYDRRHRHLWAMTRWQTYKIMEAQVGTKQLEKARIFKPADLLPLPWEKEPAEPISQQDIEELQAEMRNFKF